MSTPPLSPAAKFTQWVMDAYYRKHPKLTPAEYQRVSNATLNAVTLALTPDGRIALAALPKEVREIVEEKARQDERMEALRSATVLGIIKRKLAEADKSSRTRKVRNRRNRGKRKGLKSR